MERSKLPPTQTVPQLLLALKSILCPVENLVFLETNTVRMDETAGTMIREGVEAIVNPLDLYAVEIAIRHRHGVRLVTFKGLSYEQ